MVVLKVPTCFQLELLHRIHVTPNPQSDTSVQTGGLLHHPFLSYYTIIIIIIVVVIVSIIYNYRNYCCYLLLVLAPLVLLQTRASWSQVLARCVQWQSAVSRIVCFGQACTTSTQPLVFLFATSACCGTKVTTIVCHEKFSIADDRVCLFATSACHCMKVTRSFCHGKIDQYCLPVVLCQLITTMYQCKSRQRQAFCTTASTHRKTRMTMAAVYTKWSLLKTERHAARHVRHPCGTACYNQVDKSPKRDLDTRNPSHLMQASKSTSVAVAQPEQPQLTRMSSSATVADANIAAGGEIWQEAPCSVAAEVLNKAEPRETFAAAGGAIDAVRDATGNVAYQSNLAKGEASEADDVGPQAKPKTHMNASLLHPHDANCPEKLGKDAYKVTGQCNEANMHPQTLPPCLFP